MTSEYQRLARWITQLENRIGHGGLRNSSLEDGYVNEYDRNGVLGSIFGRQWDGGHGIVSVNGPIPPTPGDFNFRTVPGGLMVEWMGEWDPTEVAGVPVVAPSDFARVEIHASTSAGLSGLLRDTLKTTISTPRGAEVRLDLDYEGVYYVRAVTRATTGQVSAATPLMGPFTIPRATAEDLSIDEILGNTVFYGASTPTTTKTGDLWLKWVNSPTLPAQHESYRWDGDSWELLRDQAATAAALAAEAATTAANLKIRLYSQDAAPTGLTATDKAMWQDTNDGNKTYLWDGDSWEPRLIGNAAIQPASLVASTVLVTGSISAALLEAIFVVANIIIAGNAAGEHARITSDGISAYVIDDEGLPAEIGRFGRGWSVRDPGTGEITASMNEGGDGSFRSIQTTDPDPVFAGTALSTMLWALPRGIVARGELPDMGGSTAATSSETAIAALAFDAQPGRMYTLHWPAIEYVVATGDKAVIRLRHTTDGTAPSTSSAQVDAWALEEVDSTFNTMVGWHTLLPIVTVPTEMRLLLCMATSGGSTGLAANLSGRIRHFWVEDKGPAVSNTGDVLITTGATSGGGGSTPVKKQYVYESTAHWQRTWNQAGSVIYDDEMQQGYGDSFNGIRRSAAGWDGLVGLLAGSTIDSVEFYIESYHWWAMGGGTAVIGYHSQNTEPASFPGHNDSFSIGFTARSQGKWIKVSGGANGKSWGGITQNGTCRGFSLLAPSTSTAYYGKFRGGAYARPRIRVYYTK